MILPGEGYSKALTPLMHETIKKVGEDYEAMKYNTAIAAMMSLVNEFYGRRRLHPRGAAHADSPA